MCSFVLLSKPPERRWHWTLTLVGDGPEREALESGSAAGGLEGEGALPWFSLGPADVLFCRPVCLFALFEGMPNALLEAIGPGGDGDGCVA